MAKKKSAQPKVKTQWFKDQFARIDKSAREVARLMNIDAMNFHKRITGTYRFQLSEAVKLAEILGVELAEVLLNAGIKPVSGDSAKLVGYVDGDLVVHKSKGKGTDVSAFGLKGVEALLVKSPTGKLLGIDGAMLFYSEKAVVPNAAVGSLSVVEPTKGPMMVGILRKGYGEGLFNLTDFAGTLVEEGLSIEGANPILLVKI